jgi:hypothetical protein
VVEHGWTEQAMIGRVRELCETFLVEPDAAAARGRPKRTTRAGTTGSRPQR